MLTLPLSLTRRVRETAFAPLLIALTLSSGCVRKQPPPEVPIAVEHEQDGARRNPVVAEPARDPELLQLAVQSARASVPTAGAELLVRVRVDTRELPDATRPPVNLGLVIDTSSSMAGDGITGAREAALELLDALREGDRLSVVTFGSRARALVPSTRIDARSRGDVRAAIEALEPSGTTALAEGLQTGLAEVFQHQVQGAINRVVLLSDGVPNDGAQIPALADSASARGVSITALGLGLEVDESVLAVLAQRSGGRFHYLESSTEVAAVFSEEVLRMQRVVGRNMALSLSPGPGVRVIEVVGTPMNPTGRGATVSLGDLSEGETRDVFVKVQVDAHREGATVELLDARLDFDDMVKNSGRWDRGAFLSVAATDDEGALEQGVDPDVLGAAEGAVAAAVIVRAVATMRANRPAEARALLTQERARIDETLKHSGALQPARRGALEQQFAELKALDEECEKLEKTLARALRDAQRAPIKGKASAPDVVGSGRAYAPPPPAMPQAARRSHARAMQALQAN